MIKQASKATAGWSLGLSWACITIMNWIFGLYGIPLPPQVGKAIMMILFLLVHELILMNWAKPLPYVSIPTVFYPQSDQQAIPQTTTVTEPKK